MAVTILELLVGDTNYIGKENANYLALKNAVETLQAQIQQAAGPAITVAAAFEALFGAGNSIINESSYLPVAAGTDLNVAPGYFWHSSAAQVRRKTTQTVLDFNALPAATYYIVVDSSGVPTRQASSTDAAYSVVWTGSAFGAITRLVPVAWGYNTFNSAKDNAALDQTFQSLDAILEALGDAATDVGTPGAQPYVISGDIGDSFTAPLPASKSLQKHMVTEDMTLPSALIGSSLRARDTTPATATSVLIIKKNLSQIGTATFNPGGDVATFSFAAGIDFIGGTDEFELLAPATPDATLAGLYWSFRGIR